LKYSSHILNFGSPALKQADCRATLAVTKSLTKRHWIIIR